MKPPAKCALPGCTKATQFRFCCKAHQRANASREAKAERAEIAKGRKVICRWCKSEIENPHVPQFYHAGECQRLGLAAAVKEKAEQAKKDRLITKTCECGRTFEVSKNNPKRKYCLVDECTNRRQKQRRDEKKAAGTYVKPEYKPPEKKEPEYEIKFETITAICPYCRDPHEEEVVKGSSKWIYCHKHVGFRYGEPKLDPLGSGFLTTMREY